MDRYTKSDALAEFTAFTEVDKEIWDNDEDNEGEYEAPDFISWVFGN